MEVIKNVNERVSTKEAAKAIGCNEQYLRERMRDKGARRWDLGTVVKPGTRGKNYKYYVFRPKLDAFLGRGNSGLE